MDLPLTKHMVEPPQRVNPDPPPWSPSKGFGDQRMSSAKLRGERHNRWMLRMADDRGG